MTQVIGVVVIRYATVTAWGTTNELRLRMTRHVLGLDHEFHRTHTPGELIQRVDGDVTSVSDFLSLVVPQAVGGVLLISGMLGVLTVLDWRLGLGMLVYLCLVVAVLLAMRHRAISEASDEMGALAQLYGGIEERLTASEDLRGERRRRARDVALRRGQRRHAAQLGAPAAGVHPPVVGRCRAR